MGVGRGFFQFIRRADTCYSWPLFSSYPRKLSSLDKFTASSKLAPTLGKAQIAVSGCRIAGQFRQMLALGGSVLAMLDSGTRSPQHRWPPSQGLPAYVELPNQESSPLPSLGRKLLCEAHASISVPSTEKCSSDNSGLTCGWLRSLVMNLVNTSPFCSRSRFFVKVVGSQIGSSGESPTNQRYKRL